MSKMTDEQIKKALECCQMNGLCEFCYLKSDKKECQDRLHKDALDLINRQQEKIEYMQGERKILLEDMQVRNNQVIEQQAEIEKLNVELVGMRGACNSYKIHYDNAKAEIEEARIGVKSYKGKYESAVETARELKLVIAEKQAEIERLTTIAKKMHSWIFTNSCDEEKAYAECGLTNEENILLGYCGKIAFESKEMVGEGK